MKIETQKIAFVQEFLALESEAVVSKLVKLLNREKKMLSDDGNFKPFTMEEFNARIDKSEEDIREGRVVSHEDVFSKFL